jgi:hypothetical protein
MPKSSAGLKSCGLHDLQVVRGLRQSICDSIADSSNQRICLVDIAVVVILD